MRSIIIISFIFRIFIYLEFIYLAKSQTWIRAGYWNFQRQLPSSRINSALFTHLICAYADVNSTSYQLSLSPSDEQQFSSFTDTVKQKNPSVTTLLSIGGNTQYSILSTMVSNSSYRESFIDSSIRIARLFGFHGLDFNCALGFPWTRADMFNMGILFEEWRAALKLEAMNSSQSELILTAMVAYVPWRNSANYPIDSLQQYLNWVHVISVNYYNPSGTNLTSAHAALYDPNGLLNTDYGVKAWINGGLSSNKLVLCLPFYGYAWTLVNPTEYSGIGALARGPAIREGGSMTYKEIKNYIEQYDPKVRIMYNSTYVVNYCKIGTTWIGFDDVEAIIVKISYAREKKLLGYHAWDVSGDHNWVLSQAAAKEEKISSSAPVTNKNGQSKQRLLLIIIFTTAAAVILLGISFYYCWMRKFNLKAKAAAAGDLNSNDPNLIQYTLAEIDTATNGFSIENKLGEGGYGPVYKGILPNGEIVAVKKLSKTSTQGFEEFKNEVMLTAKLQHVNLVRVLGFCIDEEEQMLIYEYMPKKSLDHYLFDPIKKLILDWKRRVHIIEGVTQGLLYLQEYSRLTIIHRDLKASNVLLDDDLKPKISDFGMARIFVKEELEANTDRIAGTRGYIPPEYISRGIYSTKFDVYSFGILLLEIISGRRVSILHGPNENLSLVDYAHELWKDGKGMEFMDPALDDTNSSCKLIRCLQIALLCVRENPNYRPSMLGVYSMLKNETTEIMIPKKPVTSGEDGGNIEFTLQMKICSVNDVTLSDVVAR